MRALGLLAGVAVIALVPAVPALAGEMSFGVPYVEISIGGGKIVPKLSDLTTDNDYTPSASFDKPTAYNFGAAIGAELIPGLRGDIGLTVGKHTSTLSVQGEGSGVTGVDATTYALLASIWKDFELSDTFSLHVGGGVGVGVVNAKLSGDANSSTFDTTGLAYQVGVGGSFKLANGMTLNVDYKFSGLQGADDDRLSTETDWENIAGTYSQTSNSITVGLRIPIGSN